VYGLVRTITDMARLSNASMFSVLIYMLLRTCVDIYLIAIKYTTGER
jgi:hypothetical protein